MESAFVSSFPLRTTRTHEACGPGASAFAAIAGARAGGMVLWVRESWQTEQLAPTGLSHFLDPARLLVAQAPSQIDALAVAEEALRDGSVALVVVELHEPIGLTPGRRLQLAAQAGHSTGLCLIPESMGSNAAETRWHCAPVYDEQGEDSTLMRWKLIKNKSGTLGAWDVRWAHTAHRLDVVSPVGERPGNPSASD